MQKKGVRCPFLGCTIGYQTHSKKAQENGDISEVFLMFFGFGRDPWGYQCVTHPLGLGMGCDDAEKVV